jgi:hypothetical protein
VQRFYCYCADTTLAECDPVMNPGGRSVFILDVGEFG